MVIGQQSLILGILTSNHKAFVPSFVDVFSLSLCSFVHRHHCCHSPLCCSIARPLQCEYWSCYQNAVHLKCKNQIFFSENIKINDHCLIDINSLVKSPTWKDTFHLNLKAKSILIERQKKERERLYHCLARPQSNDQHFARGDSHGFHLHYFLVLPSLESPVRLVGDYHDQQLVSSSSGMSTRICFGRLQHLQLLSSIVEPEHKFLNIKIW